MISSVDLLRVDLDELPEKLVAVAQLARKLAEDGRVVELADLLASVRSAANEATGARLGLLEVSEAFLRALTRSDLGKTEIALRRFVISQPDGGAAVLGPLADGGAISIEALAALGAEGRELVEVGVLRALPRDRFDLRPSLRSLARELVEPAAFRAWRRVSTARGIAAMGRLKPEQAAAYLAQEFGVTQQQAEVHLRRSPLSGEVTSQQPVTPLRHQSELRVIYERASGAKPPGPEEIVVGQKTASEQADVPRNLPVSTAASGGLQGQSWS